MKLNLILGMSLLAGSAVAHHSFSAQYDAAKQVTLEGVVTKIAWANPHVFFYVDVKGADGTVVNWACETNGPNGLIRQGWKRDSLKVGRPGDGNRVSREGWHQDSGRPPRNAARRPQRVHRLGERRRTYEIEFPRRPSAKNYPSSETYCPHRTSPLTWTQEVP